LEVDPVSVLFKRARINWGDVYTGWTPGSGFINGSPRALRLVPVYAAVSLIADMFATVPQYRYRGDGTSKTQMPLPQWLIKPDPRIDAYSWKYQFVTSLKLRGNAYGIVLGPGNGPLGVRWLHPDAVSIDETDPSGPRFWVGGASEALTLYSQGGQLVHIAEFVQPGSIRGLSPIQMFKQVWETAHYATEYGHDWFERAGVPASLLMSKKGLKPGQAKEAKELFRASVKDGGPVTLDAEWDYKQLTIAPNEAQFLETIKATATTIANIFRVTPEDVGGSSGDSKTYGNRQDDDERFKVRTMLPLATRYETAVSDLLPAPQFIKLDLDAWTRPNLLDRAKADTERLKNGTLTLDEARASVDKPPLTPAQVDFWQDNFATAKRLTETAAAPPTQSTTKGA
jgi:HK97 family phage portal protein